MAPLDLGSEIGLCTANSVVCFGLPTQTIVCRDGSDMRYRTSPYEGADVLHALSQAVIQADLRCRSEECADRVDQSCDSVLREPGQSIETLAVFPLHQDDGKLAVLGRVEVDRVDPEVLGAVDDSVECLVVGKAESGFRHEKKKRGGALPIARRCPSRVHP